MKGDCNTVPCVDLHSHTTCSDGTLSPAALVERAVEMGVDLLAVTDHDTTSGLAEAQRAAAAAGLSLVPGVEISVSWEGKVLHVLGLGIDTASEPLQAGLEALARVRVQRAARLADRLAGAGIAEALEGARAQAGGGVPGRNHFARFLVEAGHARDVRRAFKRYLARGAACYVASEWASLDQALSWIAAAGGESVLAHPARYGLTRTGLRRMLAAFRDSGGGAVEVISGAQTRDLTAALAREAQAHGLKASRGSDFHEPGAGSELGRLPPLPPECVPVWHAWV